MSSDLDQMTANTTKVLGMCGSASCTNNAVGRHGFCSIHTWRQNAVGEIIPEKEERLHRLGCDEMHGHIAPKCCSPSCWCLPLLNFDEGSNNALTRWEVTSKKLTEDQIARIDTFIHGMETCLKFANGRMYLGLEAKSMLAWEFYKTDSTRPRAKPKGRREAIEHTKKKNEET